MAEVITVVSGSGGMGKSFVACNLAAGLRKLGRKVLLIEASFGLRCNDIITGIRPETMFTLGDVLSSECSPEEAITLSENPDLPDFIQASPKLLSGEIYPIKRLTRKVFKQYHTIIIDSAVPGDVLFEDSCRAADRVLVVCNDSHIAVRNAAHCVNHIRSFSSCRIYTVLNNVVVNGDGSCIEDVIDEISAELIGIIPHDEYVKGSMENGDLIYRYNTFAGRSLENIVKRLTCLNVPDYETGIESGFFNKNKLLLK